MNQRTGLREHSVQLMVVSFCLIFLWSENMLFAQQTPSDSIVIDFYLSQESWSTDSRFFVFTTLSSQQYIETQTESWNSYDVDTGQVTRASFWHLQPLLTAQDYDSFGIRRNAEGLQTTVYISPNKQYIAYANAIMDSSNLYSYIAIADLQNGQYVVTDIPVFSTGLDSFSIKWSDDSSAFTVETVSGYGAIHLKYVTGFQPDISTLTTINLNFVDKVNQEYVNIGFHDISSDGNTILLSAFPSDDWLNDKLIVWDTLTSTISEVIETERVRSAAFNPRDESSLLIAESYGVVSYDLQTHQSTEIQLDTTLQSFDIANFSPNGEWIAVAQFGSTGRGELYIVPVFDDAPPLRDTPN